MAGSFKKTVAILISLLIAFSAAAIQSSAFDEEENSRQRAELKEENSEIKEELSETNKAIKDKENEAKKLQQQLSELSEKIKNSNQKIKNLNDRIVEKQKEIDEKLKAIEDRLDYLRKRLRAIYMQGDTSSLEIILGAKDFSDFVDKAEMMQSISDYDNKLINSLQSKMKTISTEQAKLKADKKTVEEEKETLQKNLKKINTLNEQNTELIKELNTKKSTLEQKIENNKNRQNELLKALQAYNKELAQKAKESAGESGDVYSDETEYVVEPTDGYVWPCPGHTYLTSTFDEWRGANNHGALDIADGNVYGAKVVACYEGTVFSTCTTCEHDYGKYSSCGCGGGYGNYVMIDHGGGKISIYGHLSGVTVTPGQTVVGGQLIGYVGSTGYSTGPHLHFETQYNGVRYDPLSEY